MRVRPSSRPRRDLPSIAEHVAGAYSGPSDVVATGVSVASARIEAGDLFVALPGVNAHGAEYADDAVARGAVAVLTDHRGVGLLPDVPAIVVDDPRGRLADVSAWFYDHPSTAFRTIGVTGTQGKTTATYLAEAALELRRPAI